MRVCKGLGPIASSAKPWVQVRNQGLGISKIRCAVGQQNLGHTRTLKYPKP